jgi:flagellum-specific peptidoglycan hydrolase FlgJ
MMAGLWAPRDWLRDIDSEDFQQSADQIIGTVMPAIDAAKSQATDAIQSTAQAGVQAYQQAATSLPKFTIPSISSLTAGWGDSTSQPSTATDQLDTTSTGVEAPTTSSQPAASPLSRFTIPNLTSLLSGWEAPKPPETVDSTATSTPAPSGAATVSAPSMPTAPPSAQPTAPVSLPARLDTSSRDANLAQWAPALQDTERRTGLRADALAAIIQAENGGGQSPLSAQDNNYFCYDAATDVATAAGWKPWPDVTMADVLATLNPETDAIEYQRPSLLTRAWYAGPMYRAVTDAVDLLVTPEHRMWARPSGESSYRFMTAREVSGRAVEYRPLLTPVPPLAHHVGDVVGLRPLKEMVRPHAGRVVAVVQDLLLPRQRDGVRHLVRDSVGDTRPSVAQADHTVAEGVEAGSRPDPTRAEVGAYGGPVLVDLRPEAGHKRSKAGSPTRAATETGVAVLDGLSQGQEVGAACFADARNDTLVGHHDLLIRHRGVCPGRLNHGSGHRAKYSLSTWVPFEGMVYCATVPNGLVVVRRNGKVVVSGNSITAVPGRPNQAGVGQGGRFAHYNSPQDSLNDFVDLISTNPRYAEAWANRGDPQKFFQGLVKGGYIVPEPGFPVETWLQNLDTGRQHFAAIAPAPAPSGQAAAPSAARGLDVNGIVSAYKDTAYTYGGPGGRTAGFGAPTDCSGFVAAVYQNQYGLSLVPHTDGAYNQLRQAGAAEVAVKEARPGDVVFYLGAGTGGAITHHMGIYAGDGKVLDDSVSGADGVHVRDVGHAGQYVILRDPRLNQQTPQTASVPPPIQPAGVAEASGGERPSPQEMKVWRKQASDNPTSPTPSVVASASSSSTAAPSASPTSQSRPLSQDASTLIPSSAAASSQTLSPSASDTAAGNLSSADQPTMYRQPLGMPTAGPDTTDVGSPAGPPVRDDYATAGSSVPAAVPSAQAIPQEDPTAIPRPAYVPPAMPLVTAPDPTISDNIQQNPTISDAGLTPPPSPYDPQQAASMEPAPDRFSAPPESPAAPLAAVPGRVVAAAGRGINEAMSPGGTYLDEASDLGAWIGNGIRAATGREPVTTPRPSDAVSQAMDTARRAGYTLVSGTMAADVAGQVWSEFGLPTWEVAGLEINPGQFLVPAKFAGGAAPGLARAGQQAFGTGLAGAIERAPGAVLGPAGRVIGRGVGAVGSELRAGAERAATVEGERAGQRAAVAPGVFGVAPPEAGPAAEAVARPRFVPPDVRERTTPNVELPDDPRFTQAVENVGGQITDRGVELHVTRAQGESAAGQTATRGGVFVEPVREGGRSSYVTSSDNPNAVGGAVVLPPTKTLYRKPLVIDEAPGGMRGFNRAAEQLGVMTQPDPAEIERLQANIRKARADADMNRRYGSAPVALEQEHAAQQMEQDLAALQHPGPLLSADIDQGIRAARAAGPEGSPARAAALKDLVSKYGGDPTLIDPLLQIRGADASESAWAIKENIVASNARKQGYDGVFTMEDTGEPNWNAINQHPLVVKAYEDLKPAVAALDAASAAHNAAPNAANWRAYQQADAAHQAAGEAYQAAQKEAERLVGTAKLTEILDVQQGRNPTPGQLTQESRAAQIRYRAAENQYQGAIKNGSFGTDELSALRDARDRAKAEFDRVGTQFSRPPGYSLHPDVVPPSQGAAATAGITPVPVRQHTDVLASVNKALSQGVASAVSGGVGAATNQQLNPDDPNAALKGFAVGAVAPFALSRGARALATRAGRGAGPVEGALGVFGVGGRPKAQAVTNAADPTIRRVGQMMEGDYQIKTPPDPRTTAQRLGDAFAVAWTDNRAGLYRLQNSVSEALGRKLQPDEMVAELSRLNPASTASQRLSENLRPALQQVGEDQDWLSQYLVHSHNVDVAREMGQRAYETAITAGKAPAEASRLAVIAADTRQFSGDLNLAQTQKALTDIEATVKGFPDGTQRWQAIQDGAQAVWGHNRETLQRKLDAGLISQDLFNDLTQKYPRYVRTDIADYFERGSGAAKPAGRTIGTSDVGIQKLDPKGTGKDRVNPLLSTIDQTYTAESAIQRNVAGKAFEQLVDADPTWANTFREVVPQRGPNVGNPQTTVPGAYRLRGNEQFLTVWDKGDSRTFVIPGEFASLVSPQGGRVLGDSALANGWRSMMGIYKGLITSRNPAFSLVVSPIRDAGDYAIREAVASARHQGPLGAVEAVGALPGVIKDYVAAVPAAFSGILQGQFRGDLAAMMRAGAGQMSRPGHTDKELRRALGELSSAGGIQVRDLGDLRRLVGNVVTLGAGPVGERLEQVPRLAAARRAATRGASTTEQVMAFRDATVDFQRGGDLAKSINAAVPFFNTSIQGGAQVARTARQNPAAFLSSVAATIGLATAGAEAWNNSDPQRAQDYQDVPDYLKKTGIIFMLPGVTGTDQRGDRRPNFAWVPTGNYGALVGAARDAIQKSGQEQGGADLSTLSGWGSLAADVAGTFSPLRGDSAGSALTSLIPPPLSTAADLVGNKDLYRGTTIATDRADQNASALAAGSASAFNRATGQETRPSQWDYLYRDLGGFAAGAAGEASNMLAEEAGLRPRQQEQRPIQDFPVAGGMVGRVIRDSVGRGLQTAQDERNRVPESIRPILQEAGLRREQVAPVPSTLQNIPLTRAEQADWQDRTNGYIEREVDQASRSAAYRARGADQQKIIQDAIAAARSRAANEVFRQIPPAERSQRLRDAQAQKAS